MNINLTLPRTWNHCTTAQLELIADVIREQVERQDRYHPFSMQNVKIALFFALSGIEILEGPNPRIPVEEQYYTCRFQSHRSRWFSIGHKSEPFSLYLWQINYWLSPKAKTNDKTSPEYVSQGAGMLDWLENDNNQYLTKFPYKEIKRRKNDWKNILLPLPHNGRGLGGWVSFQGPEPELGSFKWEQYRLATESMQNYMQLSNNLVIMKQRGTYTDKQIQQQAASVDMAKSYFLATIFNAKIDFIESSTGMTKHDYHYQSDQITDNAAYFRNFPDTQWQVILFWWTGIMHMLSKTYPHVFKVQKVNKKQVKDSALSVYTATIATMQKYVGLNEQECNNQTYSATLEQLERMAKDNEEIERIRKKK